jgi:hypothetical protein
MKRIIKLKESELIDVIARIIKEAPAPAGKGSNETQFAEPDPQLIAQNTKQQNPAAGGVQNSQVAEDDDSFEEEEDEVFMEKPRYPMRRRMSRRNY